MQLLLDMGFELQKEAGSNENVIASEVIPALLTLTPKAIRVFIALPEFDEQNETTV